MSFTLMVAFALLVVSAFAQQTAEEYIRRGKEQLEKKQYLDAAASFEAAVKADPNLPEAYYYRGTVQLDRPKAISDFSKAIELKPNYAEAFYQRGLEFDLASKSKEALRDYNQAIELNPKYIEAYMGRAVIYMLDNKWPLAIADYTRIIELRPDGTSYYMRGNTYLEFKQAAKAIADLTTSIKLDPTYYWSYKQRAKAYMLLGKYSSAQADERKAAQLGPPKAN
ncbi:MAG TPA: tetratricopeptide repeat protein [Pyrinomonadaceae bacterium]|nr:tetratricopeptide repeat protein [Pyrinomonadaceae bacterium]